MDGLIDNLIADFRERPFPPLAARQIQLPDIPGKIDTVIGMRRVGKTSLLFQVMEQKLLAGIPKERLLYINFDDERLLPMTGQQLHLIPETYYRIYPELKNEKCFFYFDEIQNVSGWERFVRRQLDTENIQLTLTGSSAKLLSKEIATELRGRGISTEVFPFSFTEILLATDPNLNLSENPGAATRALLANRIRSYLLKGGFPEIQNLAQMYQIQILQEYIDLVILRDIIERYQISNSIALRALVRQVLSAPGCLLSINKFYNDLRTQGISCTKNALYEYLEYLEDTYLLYPVAIYNRSERVRRTNPKKIYIIDTGLIQAFTHQAYSDWGHLLENFVFMHLRRYFKKIEYYRTEDGLEVDFITTGLRGNQNLYQVSVNLDTEKTKHRELRSLATAMKELSLNKSFLITLDHHETIKIAEGTIEVLPAWQWALRPPLGLD
jgi:predicted AAA+ superfamily ATPase